jgi:hypothetical protein
MKIESIFRKDINRTIETVIKADDRDHISDEVSEYVVTKEISKSIREFFSSYNDYSGANGVWISGFFGSGKSHLLKILSYVLENKKFDDSYSGETFANKIEKDELLKGDILSASRIPSESILFNIDQQSQITTKEEANAILEVFYKVFYDHLGYYGFIPFVAEFEMWLDSDGLYDRFKDDFFKLTNKSWEESRKNYFDPIFQSQLSQVLGEIKGVSSDEYKKVLEKLEDNQKQSIEDFCQKVQSYITKKGRGFRLNFFVDEVGQYISDNTKLMLNLQTIAESLATITKGNSWILVTSQEDMESIVGDMNKSQQNDFSRIQARFKLKIPLTSANVDEVIEKRLLEKNEDSSKTLEDVYNREKEIIRTIYSFTELGVQFRGYGNHEDFINKYPFLPYQFDLFQQCRKELSKHNAFQGKHSSVGERSMLGVFQEVTRKLGESSLESLVSFDRMFEGIRNELKGEIQSSIILAENNIDSPLAIRVLKTLFLVKYYNSFKTTKRNVSVLLIDSYKVDIKKHDKEIEEALNLLENQSYIQRNGDIYEFLTDSEKDVEQEIKEVDIDDTQVNQLLREIFFDEIVKDTKIRYEDNKQDYKFSIKIDESLMTREEDLLIEIYTPNHYQFDNKDILRYETMHSNSMRIILPEDSNFIRDLKMYLRTNKYIKQTQSTSLKQEIKTILNEKATQNSQRRSNLKLMADNLLVKSEFVIGGSEVEMSSTSDGRSKVVKGFQTLVKKVYPNLKMLGISIYTEQSITQTIESTQISEFDNDDSNISEAENEILLFLQRKNLSHDRVSLNDIRSHFSSKPFGWYTNAIWTMVAKLYRKERIELRQDSNLLEKDEVNDALIKSSNHTNTLVFFQIVRDEKQVKGLKTLYSDLFDESCPYQEGKQIALEFKSKISLLYQEVNGLVYSQSYSFLSQLKPLQEKLSFLVNKNHEYFLDKRTEFEDFLLDHKEDILVPIRLFMKGDQRKIYDEIKSIITKDSSNLSFVEGDEMEKLNELISSDRPFIGTLIKDSKEVLEQLKSKLSGIISKEKEVGISKVNEIIKFFNETKEFSELDESQKQDLLSPFNTLLSDIKSEPLILKIRDLSNSVSKSIETQQLTKLYRLSSKKEDDKVEFINVSNIPLLFDKKQLMNEEDVDEYIEFLREKYKEQISKNRRIRL